MSDIPKGWVQIEWTRPKRTCVDCGSINNESGWRHDNRDRGHFLCDKCGPRAVKKAPKEEVVREVSRGEGGGEMVKRRGRPPGTKNKVKRGS